MMNIWLRERGTVMITTWLSQLPLEKMVPPQHAIFAEFVGKL